ncbi:Hypothetical protein A7982_11624 [Minicystis rosea]|nr:Hypothetical protein A7982_11624 [Minicystis rosea]
MPDLPSSHPLWRLFEQLRRRGLPIGFDDLMALHLLMQAGFGWSSRSALRDLCRALWAKSREEQDTLDAVFGQLMTEDWELSRASPPTSPNSDPEATAQGDSTSRRPEGLPEAGPHAPSPDVVASPGRLPAVRIDERRLSARTFVLTPQYPMTFREAAQAWRRLRRPVRFGPPAELDVRETVVRRIRTGVATPPLLVPRRRNTARVLLLVDRDGSMAPFHDFVDMVCRAILQTAQLGSSARFFFHDLPVEGANDAAIAALPQDELFPEVDDVLAKVRPAADGWLYRGADLAEPAPLAEVLHDHGASRAVVVVSDAGAARGRYDPGRVIDSLGFTLGLRARGAAVVWLNPLPRARWHATTAGELARHVPMFPLDREGTHRAVNVLRGQGPHVERPV